MNALTPTRSGPMTRRRAAALALVLALGAGGSASAFPEREIQMVVPFGPGGTTDLMARILQDEFAKALGATVVVRNVAGAGGTIGMSQVARAPADGHTLAMTTVGPQTIQPARRRNVGYGPDDFDYICGTYDVPLMTLVPPDSPHRTLQDLAGWAKANPGKFNYGSSGIGTALHISMLQLAAHFGVEALHVPYRSTGNMIGPIRSGEITAFNETPPVATTHQLRPLLVLADRAPAGFEQVPTARQLGIPVRGSVWGGVVAPKGLPPAVRDRLEQACRTATSATMYRARAQAANSPLSFRDGAEFRRFALQEFAKFSQVVRDHGLQQD